MGITKLCFFIVGIPVYLKTLTARILNMPLKEMPLSKYLFFLPRSCIHCIARYVILVTVVLLPGFACLDVYRRESFIFIS